MNTKTTKIKIQNKKIRINYRGIDPNKLIKKSIAIVGSRRMTRYGREVVDKFVSSFVAEGITTISGFMYGVDSEVHQKTVDYGGKTLAVFGCGLDVIYPPENKKLYDQILKNNGSIVSEYEDNAKPHLWKFPQRNRIVAGLSTLGVLVIEAGLNSGSLVTAKLAKKIGKKVYAIPGPINSTVSMGCNDLIKKKGAIMVTEPFDILGKNQSHFATASRDEPNLIGLENQILNLLQNEELNIDEISAMTNENIVEIGKTISLMAIRGLITESGGKYYAN